MEFALKLCKVPFFLFPSERFGGNCVKTCPCPRCLNIDERCAVQVRKSGPIIAWRHRDRQNGGKGKNGALCAKRSMIRHWRTHSDGVALVAPTRDVYRLAEFYS